MRPDDINPADIDDEDDDVDLDPDGAPCLVCGQTVPGPRPAMLCPDCAAVADASTTPGTTTGPATTGPAAGGTERTGTGRRHR